MHCCLIYEYLRLAGCATDVSGLGDIGHLRVSTLSVNVFPSVTGCLSLYADTDAMIEMSTYSCATTDTHLKIDWLYFYSIDLIPITHVESTIKTLKF